MQRSKLLFGLCFLGMMFICSLDVFGQQKKPLDHDAYDIWNRITQNAISNNGNWIMFTLAPEDKDAELRIKDSNGNLSYLAKRGDSGIFSYDSEFAVFKIKAFKDSVKAAKREKKKGPDLPKDSLAIYNLSSGEVVKIARVKSFKMPKEAGGMLAYLLEKSVKKEEDAGDKEKPKEEEKEKKKEKVKKEKPKSDKKKKTEGTDLVLRNLETGSENRYSDVTEYYFSQDGKWLVYTASNKDSTADGIIAVMTETAETVEILTGKGDYKQVAIDENGKQVAFLTNRDNISAKQPSFSLYQWRIGSGFPKLIAKEGTTGIETGWWVSENGKVSFSKNGKRLFFATAPRPEPEPDEEESEDEKVKIDIWNWKDPLLQPMQLLQAKNELKRSYQAVVHLNNSKIVQLATKDIPSITVGGKGNADIAIGNSNMPYRQQISWESPRYYDVYLVDLLTGQRSLVLEKVQSQASLSPGAKYITWWDRDELAWFAMDIKKNSQVNLSKKIPYPVYNEIHDWPYKANSYRNAGWTNNDQEFVIYDKHDLWAVDPAGKKAPRSITKGLGRSENIQFRYSKLNLDEEAINPKEAILLSAFQYNTKDAGFYRLQMQGNQKPAKLTMMAKAFSRPKKAKNGDKLLFTRSSYVDFPDLWTSDLKLSNMKKISDVNPQQSEYLWGTAGLVEWSSLDGIPLQGILYKPENFDPTKKYPMMVYFYEKSSNSIHRHRPPATARSSISFSFYVSRGYVVFVPDIPYKIGYPGESALNAVVPGVLHVTSLGFVDEENIGVQGHSWGGYQIAYMVTRTNIFKAAEAGAPVSNMTSAYGGIRWGTGMILMFQYERTQSRIGGSLWEYPMRYFENSPIFWADKIQTPVLMMHNDKDTAVPWYQGIEFFVALRRLGKPVWMLNYNGEPHGLRKYQNKRDFAIRMQQYFDFYLKGAPAPVWLEEGVPAIKKGKTLGLEPVSTEIAEK